MTSLSAWLVWKAISKKIKCKLKKKDKCPVLLHFPLSIGSSMADPFVLGKESRRAGSKVRERCTVGTSRHLG